MFVDEAVNVTVSRLSLKSMWGNGGKRGLRHFSGADASELQLKPRPAQLLHEVWSGGVDKPGVDRDNTTPVAAVAEL